MKIEFDTPKEIVLVKEIKKEVSEVTIREMRDLPEQKRVEAITDLLGIVVLWQGEEYDAIGQWTDQDVINKIKSL
jgi:hypothetical protein